MWYPDLVIQALKPRYSGRWRVQGVCLSGTKSWLQSPIAHIYTSKVSKDCTVKAEAFVTRDSYSSPKWHRWMKKGHEVAQTSQILEQGNKNNVTQVGEMTQSLNGRLTTKNIIFQKKIFLLQIFLDSWNSESKLQ